METESLIAGEPGERETLSLSSSSRASRGSDLKKVAKSKISFCFSPPLGALRASLPRRAERSVEAASLPRPAAIATGPSIASPVRGRALAVQAHVRVARPDCFVRMEPERPSDFETTAERRLGSSRPAITVCLGEIMAKNLRFGARQDRVIDSEFLSEMTGTDPTSGTWRRTSVVRKSVVCRVFFVARVFFFRRDDAVADVPLLSCLLPAGPSRATPH